MFVKSVASLWKEKLQSCALSAAPPKRSSQDINALHSSPEDKNKTRILLVLGPNMYPYQVLALAIRSEIEAVNIYSRLYEDVKNELLKKKLRFLIFEEKMHKQILERLYSQRFPEKKLELPERSFLPQVKLSLNSKISILGIFKAALGAERMSEDFYKKASQKAENKESRKILEYLSRVERSHYFMIKSEIDLFQKFPDYYDVEDFNIADDLVHIGP